jgi:preprotein translocase subunit SecD
MLFGVPNMGDPVPPVVVTPAPAKNFAGTNGGVKFAIVLDGIVQSALGLNTDHFGGSAQIVGNFSAEPVNNLVTVLTFGPLPVDVQEVSLTQVSCATGA